MGVCQVCADEANLTWCSVCGRTICSSCTINDKCVKCRADIKQKQAANRKYASAEEDLIIISATSSSTAVPRWQAPKTWFTVSVIIACLIIGALANPFTGILAFCLLLSCYISGKLVAKYRRSRKGTTLYNRASSEFVRQKNYTFSRYQKKKRIYVICAIVMLSIGIAAPIVCYKLYQKTMDDIHYLQSASPGDLSNMSYDEREAARFERLDNSPGYAILMVITPLLSLLIAGVLLDRAYPKINRQTIRVLIPSAFASIIVCGYVTALVLPRNNTQEMPGPYSRQGGQSQQTLQQKELRRGLNDSASLYIANQQIPGKVISNIVIITPFNPDFDWNKRGMYDMEGFVDCWRKSSDGTINKSFDEIQPTMLFGHKAGGSATDWVYIADFASIIDRYIRQHRSDLSGLVGEEKKRAAEKMAASEVVMYTCFQCGAVKILQESMGEPDIVVCKELYDSQHKWTVVTPPK